MNELVKQWLINAEADMKTERHELDLGENFSKPGNLEYFNCDPGNLTEYAVEIRYPDDFYIPTFQKAKKAYGLALQIIECVKNKLGGSARE